MILCLIIWDAHSRLHGDSKWAWPLMMEVINSEARGGLQVPHYQEKKILRRPLETPWKLQIGMTVDDGGHQWWGPWAFQIPILSSEKLFKTPNWDSKWALKHLISSEFTDVLPSIKVHFVFVNYGINTYCTTYSPSFSLFCFLFFLLSFYISIWHQEVASLVENGQLSRPTAVAIITFPPSKIKLATENYLQSWGVAVMVGQTA